MPRLLPGDLKAGDYTEASWTALENALASARAILSDEDATQDEVDQALRALESARGALEKTPVVPVENPTKKQLKALVKQAKETDTRGKTDESVKALTDAITYAEDILGDENASDTQLQAAYDQLKLAIESLRDADSGNQGGSGNQGSGNGSNGGNQAASPQATRPRQQEERFGDPQYRRPDGGDRRDRRWSRRHHRRDRRFLPSSQQGQVAPATAKQACPPSHPRTVGMLFECRRKAPTLRP